MDASAVDAGTADALLLDAGSSVCGTGDAGAAPALPWTSLAVLAGQPGSSGSFDGIGSTARFNGPMGVAADGAGDLYVTDMQNNTIRRVVLATGAVTTFAGVATSFSSCSLHDGIGPVAGFCVPWGLAIDRVGGSLYVADNLNEAVRKIDVASRQVTTVFRGGLGGSGVFPAGLTFDGAHTLYMTTNTAASVGGVCGAHIYTVDKLDLASGVDTTIAGQADNPGAVNGVGAGAQFGNPDGIAFDRSGTLYVNDQSSVRRIALASDAVTTFAGDLTMRGILDGVGTTARFSDARGLAEDGKGNLYLADGDVGYDAVLRTVAVSSATVATVAGSSSAVGNSDGVGSVARFSDPEGVTIDSSTGELYAADFTNDEIRRFDPAFGQVTTVAGAAPSPGSSDGVGMAARFDRPWGIAADDKTAYIADTGNDTIRAIDLATGTVTTLAGSPGSLGTTNGTGTAARFSSPEGVALDGAGNLYVADAGNATIRRIVIASGAVTTIAGTPGLQGAADGVGAAARFGYVMGIAWDASSGNLFVADSTNNTIRRVAVASATITTFAGTAGAFGSADGTGAAVRFVGPSGVAADGAGTLYVADTGNFTVRAIATASAAVTTLSGAPGLPGSIDGPAGCARFAGPQGMAVDGSGNLFVSDGPNQVVRRIALRSRSVGTIVGSDGAASIAPGPLPGVLDSPGGLALTPGGALLIASQRESSVLVVQ